MAGAADIQYNGESPWDPNSDTKPTAYQPYGVGYDTIATQRRFATQTARSKGQNCILSNGTNYIALWVHDLSSDIALAGSTSQSARTRTFYPRSFVQPTFTLLGIAPSQLEYGRMIEFMHLMQQNAVATGALTTLTLPGDGYKVKQNMKGYHQGISAEGYVTSIDRDYERFEYAPEYTLSFVVAHMHSGPFQDTITTGAGSSSWAATVSNSINGVLTSRVKS